MALEDYPDNEIDVFEGEKLATVLEDLDGSRFLSHIF
tara:strand:+ start:411 stop:521 length:111 start_codon:yes stop_codon:yes gene_type:complete